LANQTKEQGEPIMAKHDLRDISRGQQLRHTGFTLMEVLLVLVILVILGSIVVPLYTGIQSGAEVKTARTQVDLLEHTIDIYKLNAKKLPSSLDDLVQRPSDLKEDRWAGPYIKENKDLVDPWDNPYKYTPNGKHNTNGYDVWSTGPDGQDGNDDDIGNWKST
jgi:general secretion pathway protein G